MTHRLGGYLCVCERNRTQRRIPVQKGKNANDKSSAFEIRHSLIYEMRCRCRGSFDSVSLQKSYGGIQSIHALGEFFN